MLIALFAEGATELADLVDAVRTQLAVPPEAELAVSYSGGLFHLHELMLAPLEAALARRSCGGRRYQSVNRRDRNLVSSGKRSAIRPENTRQGGDLE